MVWVELAMVWVELARVWAALAMVWVGLQSVGGVDYSMSELVTSSWFEPLWHVLVMTMRIEKLM